MTHTANTTTGATTPMSTGSAHTSSATDFARRSGIVVREPPRPTAAW